MSPMPQRQPVFEQQQEQTWPPAAGGSSGDGEHWHIGKKIPLALIITLFIGFIGQGFYFSKTIGSYAQQFIYMKARQDKFEADQNTASQKAAETHDMVIRLTSDVHYINDGIAEIKAMIRRRENKADKKQAADQP